MTTDKSVLVDWPSTPLSARTRATVSVRVQGVDQEWSSWKSVDVETGLLSASDWTAVPITNHKVPSDIPKRPYRVRKVFRASKQSRVRLYITALGVYEAYLNGKRIGEDVLAPGWTSYKSRLAYQTYNITDLLVEGDNIFGAWIAEGWYAGTLGFGGGKRNIYGDQIGLIAQLEIDGKPSITSDDTWEWSDGALISSGLYDGETYDTSLPDSDFTEGDWKAVQTMSTLSMKLFSSQSPPVREISKIRPTEIIITPSGKTVLDFGQNFAGVIRILSDAPTSGELIIRHAEVMENGELGTRPLRLAKAVDRIMLSSRSARGYMPRFTTHGFRYAQIEGWHGIRLDDIEGVVLQSSMRNTGDFSSSHDLINRLYKNAWWSAVGNTISLPTDCPQRDERLGWTGDICVFSPTLSYMFDTAGFLGEWLRDLSHEQDRFDGVVPIFVPATSAEFVLPQAIWGDTAVLTPYDLFQGTGDIAILAIQYQSARSWLERGVRRDEPTGLWNRTEDQLADWLAPKASPHMPSDGPTDNILVADAWLIHSTQTMAKIAHVLGKIVEAEKWESEARRLTIAFYQEYVTPTGRLASDTQTALCLLLRYDIFPPLDYGSVDYREIFAARLVELVTRANWDIDTGFAGTPIVLQTLAATGHIDHAYRMLQAKNCPSWLACVLLGATTIWERWDSMLPDGTINPGEMTSFNHYALGSVASFMHEQIGGLSPLEPGWKRVLVKPQPGGTMTSASTSHESPYGLTSVKWHISEGKMNVDIVIPPNVTAKIVLPGLEESVGSGSHTFIVDFEQPAFPPKEFVYRFSPPRPNQWVA